MGPNLGPNRKKLVCGMCLLTVLRNIFSSPLGKIEMTRLICRQLILKYAVISNIVVNLSAGNPVLIYNCGVMKRLTGWGRRDFIPPPVFAQRFDDQIMNGFSVKTVLVPNADRNRIHIFVVLNFLACFNGQ